MCVYNRNGLAVNVLVRPDVERVYVEDAEAQVGERKHCVVLSFCEALQQLWGSRNSGKRAAWLPCITSVSGALQALSGRGAQ
jgi:hypothetical protein